MPNDARTEMPDVGEDGQWERSTSDGVYEGPAPQTATDESEPD